MYRSSSPLYHKAYRNFPDLGHSHRQSPVPSMFDQESLHGLTNEADTSFELMSATQLREQLRREQTKRKETEVEVEILKQNSSGASRGQISNTTAKRALHHSAPGTQDSDSGIGYANSISRTKSPFLMRPPSPIINPDIPPGSQSNTRFQFSSPPFINKTQDVDEWTATASSGALKNLRDAMYESEQRRVALVEKLREAHGTLQLQTERLCDCESKFNDTQHTIEGLSIANQSLQKKLIDFEKDKEESISERMVSVRHRERLQSRVDELDRELKEYRALYATVQAEQAKRDLMVEQTSRTLLLIEEENKSFQKTKETMMKETIALRESLQITRIKLEKLETENKHLDKLRETGEVLAVHNNELQRKVAHETRTSNELKHDYEKTKEQLEKLVKERDYYEKQASEVEEKNADLNSKFISASTAKERYMQEKLDMQQVMRQALLDKEHEQKAKQDLDGKLTELQLEVTQTKLHAEKSEEDLETVREELSAVKKVCEVLSSELATAKENLEKTQEELRNMTADKRSSQQQQSYWEGEAKRIAGERDTLSKSIEQMMADFNKERSQLDEQHLELREGMKETRNEKIKSQSKCQELEQMLHRANEDLKESAIKNQEEMEEWKNTCETLSSNLGRKEAEVSDLHAKFEQARSQISDLKVNLQDAVLKQEKLLEFRDEAEKLQQENERLNQEHGEDQQVINLLEMQKEILAKSQATGVPKHNADQMQAEIDHLKAELGLAEDKIAELREELARGHMHMVEIDGGSVVTRSARSTPAVCERCAGLTEQVSNLKEMNKLLTEKIGKLEKNSEENSSFLKMADEAEQRFKDQENKCKSMSDLNKMLNEKVARLEKEKAEILIRQPQGEMVSKSECDQIQTEKIQVETDLEHLQMEHAELQTRHQQFVSNHLSRTLDNSGFAHFSPGKRENIEEVRKYRQENDILNRQVELLRSQCILAENGKKRAEDRIRQLEKELVELQQELSEEREKNIISPEVEAALRSQLNDKDQIIRQIQTELATKNVALENALYDSDNRMAEKKREFERILVEREDWSTLRHRLEQEKVSLEIKIEEQKMIIDQLRDEKPRLLNDKDNHIKEIEEEAIQATRNAKKLEIDVKNLQEELSHKDQELMQLQLRKSSEIDSLHEEKSKQSKELQLSVLRKENEMSQLKQDIQKKNEEYREILQEKTKKEIELEQMRAEASRTVEHLTSIVEKQENEITNLREEVNKKVDQLEGIKNTQDSDVENLKQMLSQANKELTRMQNTKETELEEMEDLLRKQEQEYKRVLQKKEVMINNLSDEMEDQKLKQPKMKESMDEVQEELMEVKAELQQMNKVIRLKEAELEEQQRSLADSDAKIERLQKERRNMKKEMETEQEERAQIIKELKRKLDGKESEMESLQDLNRTMEDKKGNSDTKTKRLEDKVKGQIEEIQSLNKLVSNLQTRNRKLDQSNENLQRDFEQFKGEKSNCVKCSKSDAQNEELLQQKESLEEENEELHRELERLESLLNIHLQDPKGANAQKSAQKTLMREGLSASMQGSGLQTPNESPSPRAGGKAANPLQLAAALKRLSVKPSGNDKKLSPKTSDTESERRKSFKGLPEVGEYDETRRTSLNDLESRIQRLQSSQQKSMKDLRKSSLKPESVDKSAEKTTPRKQARFVLPSSKKFDASQGSLSSSLGSSRREKERVKEKEDK